MKDNTFKLFKWTGKIERFIRIFLKIPCKKGSILEHVLKESWSDKYSEHAEWPWLIPSLCSAPFSEDLNGKDVNKGMGALYLPLSLSSIHV